jgi:hypothetical protein
VARDAFLGHWLFCRLFDKDQARALWDLIQASADMIVEKLTIVDGLASGVETLMQKEPPPGIPSIEYVVALELRSTIRPVSYVCHLNGSD